MLLLLLLLTLLVPGRARAQVITAGPDSTRVTRSVPDTTRVVEQAGLSRPAKAALWGLIPGGGQVYNHDYWKLPIVYVALGAATFGIWWNQDRYIRFSRAYRRRTADSTYVDPDALTSKYTTANLPRGQAFYRRNRDLNVILLTAVYGLSIMEALVDAHLSTFTVSDDLSLRVSPAVVPAPGILAPGMGLTLTIR